MVVSQLWDCWFDDLCAVEVKNQVGSRLAHSDAEDGYAMIQLRSCIW